MIDVTEAAASKLHATVILRLPVRPLGRCEAIQAGDWAGVRCSHAYGPVVVIESWAASLPARGAGARGSGCRTLLFCATLLVETGSGLALDADRAGALPQHRNGRDGGICEMGKGFELMTEGDGCKYYAYAI